MGILKKIFGATPIGAVVNTVSDIAEQIFGTSEDKTKARIQKAEFDLALEQLLQKRDSEMEETLRVELGAKERILVAELQQGDKFTKRARPAVVYFGMFFFFFNYSLVPLFGMPQLLIPEPFMWGWSGIVGTWSVGRSAERIGKRNRVIDAITGSGKGIPGLLGL